MQTEIRLYLNKMKTKLVETKNDTKTRQNLTESPFWSCCYMIFCHFQKQKQITNSCAKSQSAFLFAMFLFSFQVMKIYLEKFITLTSFLSHHFEISWRWEFLTLIILNKRICKKKYAAKFNQLFAPFVNFNFTLITILKMRLFCHGDQGWVCCLQIRTFFNDVAQFLMSHQIWRYLIFLTLRMKSGLELNFLHFRESATGDIL